MDGKFYEFCDIIRKLRSPGGCPWDREQTHESLAKFLIEEAYEAYDAAFEDDKMHLADELGDCLLQICLHSDIAREKGEFDIEDVIALISKKMIERHPHVFSDKHFETSDEVLESWEDIKRKQRGQKTVSESMEDITPSLPPMERALKVLKKVKKLKLGKISYPESFLKDNFEPTGENIGDALFTLCILSQQNGIDPSKELSSSIGKFIKKVKNIEENT